MTVEIAVPFILRSMDLGAVLGVGFGVLIRCHHAPAGHQLTRAWAAGFK